ncbi:MAG: acyl-CoA synthetase [Pseudomonadota bacterium]
MALRERPTSLNLTAYCLDHWARVAPHREALRVLYGVGPAASRPLTFTYGEVDRTVRAYAAVFARQGLAPGDRIFIRLANDAPYVFAFFGAMAGGFVPVPASDQLSDREVADLIADCAPSLVVSDLKVASMPRLPRIGSTDLASQAQSLDPPPYAAMRPDDPAFLIYTSGTTGRPKGVLHAQRSIWGRRPMFAGWHDLTSDDRLLHAGAFNWTYTLGVGLSDAWTAGATALLFAGDRNPEVWPDLIAQENATIFCAVPSLYRQILKYGKNLRARLASLRHGLTAGEALTQELRSTWDNTVGVPLFEALGMSEVSTFISCSPSVPVRPGSPGRAQAGRRVCVLPEDTQGTDPLPANRVGLLAVHASDPGLFLGYWKRPEEEAAVFRGAWFIGGDRVSMDEAGYITHHGRANDVMNAFGYRVAPQEVEAALLQHPAVQDCAVAEHQVREDVSVIAAWIVATTPHPSADALEAFLTTRLAAYKHPRAYHFVSTLPRTRTGKLQRRALQDLAYSTQNEAGN